jgi:hypothetical protein
MIKNKSKLMHLCAKGLGQNGPKVLVNLDSSVKVLTLNNAQNTHSLYTASLSGK